MPEMNKGPRKTYVLDTTVLIYDPDVMFKTGEADWVIPLAVIREIDGLKNSDKELVAKAARQIARTLDRFGSYGDLVAGVKLPTARILRIIEGYESIDALASDADNKILGAALLLKNVGENVTLFTADTNMRTVARVYGIKAEYTPFFDSDTNTIKEGKGVKSDYLSGIHDAYPRQGKRHKPLRRTLKAFNRYFLPPRVKLILLLFMLICCSIYYCSRKLTLSLALGSLGVVLLWFLSGLVRGKTHIPAYYAGEDADGDSIWIFRR